MAAFDQAWSLLKQEGEGNPYADLFENYTIGYCNLCGGPVKSNEKHSGSGLGLVHEACAYADRGHPEQRQEQQDAMGQPY